MTVLSRSKNAATTSGIVGAGPRVTGWRRPPALGYRPTRRCCTAGSASPVTSTSTSSPALSTVSPRGTTKRSSRTTATTVASRGKSSSASEMPSAGDPSARVTSTRWAFPPSNCSNRTNEPTDTASSTSAVISCCVETDTSTPQDSLNSHWFFGWLTRATTRGTANSCLARREMTRSSSSSPVAATTTSTVARPAASRELTSHASAATHVTSISSRRRSTRSGSRSISSTSCPLARRSRAIAVPTLPPPAMATFTCSLPCRSRPFADADRPLFRGATGDAGFELLDGVLEHCHVEHVSLLADQLRHVQARHARPGDRDHGGAAGHPQVAQTLAGPRHRQHALDQYEPAGGIRPFAHDRLGQQPPQHLVDGPGDGGHRGNAQALVDLGAARVVDTGHDVGDPVGLAGDAGRQDVGVVAVGDGGQCAGFLGTRPLEVVAVEAGSHHRGAGPARGQPTECRSHAVDDGHGVAVVHEADAQARADAAATDDDDVHRHHATRRSGCSPVSVLSVRDDRSASSSASASGAVAAPAMARALPSRPFRAGRRRRRLPSCRGPVPTWVPWRRPPPPTCPLRAARQDLRPPGTDACGRRCRRRRQWSVRPRHCATA